MLIVSLAFESLYKADLWGNSSHTADFWEYSLHSPRCVDSQPIAFWVSLNLNLQSQSGGSLFNGTCQTRPRKLDFRLDLEAEYRLFYRDLSFEGAYQDSSLWDSRMKQRHSKSQSEIEFSWSYLPRSVDRSLLQKSPVKESHKIEIEFSWSYLPRSVEKETHEIEIGDQDWRKQWHSKCNRLCGVAPCSRLLQMIGLFCKRAL